MAEPLTPAMQDKIFAATEMAIDYVHDGDDPSTAIAKAAREIGLSKDQVDPVVFAYNTARVRSQQQEGSTLLEKTATFELAATDKVKSLLYPAHAKTAAQRHNETAVSPIYSYSARLVSQQLDRMSKTASARLFPEEPPPKPAAKPDVATEQRLLHGKRLSLKTAMEEPRRLVSQARDKFANAVAAFVGYFDGGRCVPLPIVKDNALILYGDRVEPLFAKLAELRPNLAKQPQHSSPQQLRKYAAAAAVGAPYTLIVQAIEAAEAWETQIAASQQKMAALEQEYAATAPPVVERRGEPGIDLLAPEPTTLATILGLSKEAMGFAGGIKDFALMQQAVRDMAAGVGGSPDAAVQKNLDKLTDPEHEAKLKSIHTQAILHDLMSNDPVIAGFPPHQVLGAFNDIAQAMPSGADQRMLMQTALRQHLQQGVMNPFDVDQMYGMENKLRQRAQPPVAPGGGIV